MAFIAWAGTMLLKNKMVAHVGRVDPLQGHHAGNSNCYGVDTQRIEWPTSLDIRDRIFAIVGR
jgi:hypothetical protein